MSGCAARRRDWERVCRAAGLAVLAGLAVASASRAAAPSSSDPVAAEKPVRYELKYKFRPDQTIYSIVDHRTRLVTQKVDIRETTANESTEYKHVRVVSVDADGSATLEPVLDRVQMSALFDGSEPLSVDSRDPEGCPRQYRGVLKTIGKPLARIQVRPNGTVVSVERRLAPHLQAAVTPGDTTGTPDDDPGKSFLLVLPDRPLSVGDTWHDDFEVLVSLTGTLRQTIALRRKYTLESVEGDVARIRMKTAVLTAVRHPQILAELILRTPEGTIDFDMAQGLIVRRTTTSNETVIGPFGANSSMQATSERVERVLHHDEFARRVAAAPRTVGRTAQ